MPTAATLYGKFRVGSRAVNKRGPVVSDAWPWVAAQMNDRGWRQPQLAKAIGYSVASVSRWLSGEQRPEQPAVEAIASAFCIQSEAVPAWIDVTKIAPEPTPQKEVTSDPAVVGVVSHPVTPAEDDYVRGGMPLMDKAILGYNMLKLMSDEQQAHALRLIGMAMAPPGAHVEPAQPAHRRSLSQSSRRKRH